MGKNNFGVIVAIFFYIFLVILDIGANVLSLIFDVPLLSTGIESSVELVLEALGIGIVGYLGFQAVK